MLPSIEAAYNVSGPLKKTVAAKVGRCESQRRNWFSGHTEIPKHKRQSIDLALGAPVDWDQYNREFAALHRKSSASQGGKPYLAPAPTKITQSPPEAPKRGFLSNLLSDDGDESDNPSSFFSFLAEGDGA